MEFEGAVEGIGVAPEVSLMGALGVVVDVMVVPVACDVESWDERLGKSEGGGYFWKKRRRRGGSDLASSTVCWALIVDVVGVATRLKAAGVNIKSSSAKAGLSCEVASPCGACSRPAAYLELLPDGRHHHTRSQPTTESLEATFVAVAFPVTSHHITLHRQPW